MTTPASQPVPRDTLLGWYRDMALIRRVEELAAKAYTLRKIKGFCHLYIGEEAVAVGACAALQPADTVVTAYRDHGHYLARGGKPGPLMAELFGKSTGTTKGVGGSMHISDSDLNFFGGYGIVGGHVPLATGAAFAAHYRETTDISLCFLGDGAAQQGAFFESLALAQLWGLPAVFLVENNYYAMGTSIDRASYLTDMSKRGDGVGMKNWQFKGYDVVEVYDNVSRAVAHARSGKGPVLLEAVTYRYRGHSMSDPAKYRKPGELETQKDQFDALTLAANRLMSEFGVSESELQAIVAEVNTKAQAAYDGAEQAPEADLAKLYDFVYASYPG